MKGLPGEQLVRQGLADLKAGLHTVPSCLVRIARRRLTRAGLIDPSDSSESSPAREPELELYALLKEEEGDAYSRYNSLLRELISFENAVDHRLHNQKV